MVAGPGTGKSRCIEERVNYLLQQGAQPSEVFVISFTRATARELKERIVRYCTQTGRGHLAQVVNVSTMHALALRILRSANLLQGFPVDPTILDEWEQDNIFDSEFVARAQLSNGRARQIRRAYDAHWQTLQALQLYATPPITQTEQNAFTGFHTGTKLVYACLLPGEVVRVCVDQMRMGNINPAQMPGVRHLVVDEYQDLNECDQEFVRRIAGAGATLWVAGDDDQSIYAFRYAAPIGIQNFPTVFPGASSHTLEHCFRSTPNVVSASQSLMAPSPNRLPKSLQSLYGASQPPVQGSFQVWRFAYGFEEARSIAQSCQALIASGMPPRDILILLCNTRAQLQLFIEQLQAAGIAFERPRGGWMLDSDMTRFVFSLLRILIDSNDYVAHRTLLGLHNGVGPGTCVGVAAKVVSANLNFRELFYSPYPNNIFSLREHRAIQQAAGIVQHVANWSATDTLQTRAADMEAFISAAFNAPLRQAGQQAVQGWRDLLAALPQGMNLEELHSYLWSDTEAGQLRVLDSVSSRLGLNPTATQPDPTHRIRILTMHGAKGLDGRVVFIPGLERGLIPNRQSLQAPGLFEEQRRLLYVSITRARAACILSLATTRTGQQAFALVNSASVNLAPSPYLTDIGIPPQPRNGPLTAAEVASLLTDCGNL